MNFNSIFFENLEIILDQNSKFKINFVRNQKVFDQVLVLDIYDLNNHVHPEGHIGWWSYDIQDVFEGEINIKNGFLSPICACNMRSKKPSPPSVTITSASTGATWP